MSTEREQVERELAEELGFRVVNPKVAGIGHVPEFVEGDGESDTDYIADGRHWALFEALLAARLKLASVERELTDALSAARNFGSLLAALTDRAESASLKLAAADRLAEAVKLLTSMKFPIGGGDCPHGEESWYCVCCRSEWDDELAKAKTALRSALLEYSRTKV